MNKKSKKREVSILGLSYSQSSTGSYVVVLSEKLGKRKLPIIVKTSDAQVIALKVENIKSPTILIQDVFKSSLDSFGIDCQEVVIYKMLEGIFYSKLVLYDGVDQSEVEASAGEAISIGLTFNCPLYIEEEVLNECGIYTDDYGNVVDPEESESMDDSLSVKQKETKNRVISLEDLKKMMDEAIANEDYETASIIRDKINQLNTSK